MTVVAGILAVFFAVVGLAAGASLFGAIMALGFVLSLILAAIAEAPRRLAEEVSRLAARSEDAPSTRG